MKVPDITPSISEDLRSLEERFRHHAAPLGHLLSLLGSRASAVLIVLCALPFCSPMTIPGLSIPFGLVILLLAARYSLGLPPWLPERLTRVQLSPQFLGKLLRASSRLIGWLEHLGQPSWGWLNFPLWKMRMHSLVVMASALFLLLPLPPLPPFTNTLPALVIVIVTMSTTRQDGRGIALGYATFLVMLGYFAFWTGLILPPVMSYIGHM